MNINIIEAEVIKTSNNLPTSNNIEDSSIDQLDVESRSDAFFDDDQDIYLPIKKISEHIVPIKRLTKIP